MQEPTREEALKFLQILDRLCMYEIEQRMIRSHVGRSYGGIFHNEELPIPEVVTVVSWLNSKFDLTLDDMKSWKKDMWKFQPE